MLSKDFLNGIEFELQNRAFALKAITRISNRMQGTPSLSYSMYWGSKPPTANALPSICDWTL